MKRIVELISEIGKAAGCVVKARSSRAKIQLGYELPEDLRYFLEGYQAISLYETSDYPMTVVGIDGFKRANPEIMGEIAEGDISYNWFIVAIGNDQQYITIDLARERLGKCYDSFWDRYGVAGEQPIIALSFSELLQQLFENKGKYYYWLENNFQNLGDAYDN